MSKKLDCLFCPNLFDNFEDLMHHLELDHIGIDSKLLQEATFARETKKQLGNYLDISKKGSGLECPTCFEIFKDIDEISKHGRIEHNREFDPKFLEKIKELVDNTKNNPPVCTRCHRKFLGLITTKINKTVQNVCFNCYEKYFGTNALARITIGTPDEMILKMRNPLK